LTEFLPVSSSGHLVIFQKLLGLPHDLVFDAFVHLATALAVFLFFYRDIIGILKGFFIGIFRILKGESKFLELYRTEVQFRMSCLLLAATFVTGILGLSFKDYFEALFSSPRAAGSFLILTAVLIFVAEIMPKGKKEIGQMTVLDALVIGLFQGFAIAPGISRSGATISAGLMRGVKRDLSARFAFILAIPAILGANLMQLPKAFSSTFQGDCMFTLCMGAIAAFVSGYFAIKVFMDIIQKMSIRGFAYYCLAAGFLVIIFI
jgi:undecaprenyl-diphosphatase